MSRYPWTRQKRFSASSMPAAVQRSIIIPSRLRLTFRIVVRPIEIIDSNRLDVADRFEAGGVVAGRQPRDHALERHLPEQIFRVEVLVGGEFDLTGAVEIHGREPDGATTGNNSS